MAINKHGLKMTGLKKTAGLTREVWPCGPYVQIFYDPETGKVWGIWHDSENSWSIYQHDDYLHVANCSTPKTMQYIADKVKEAVDAEKEYEKYGY